MKYSAIAAGVILSTLGFSGTAHAEDDAFITALKAGKPLLNLRLRHEEVDSDGAAEDAQATCMYQWSTPRLIEVRGHDREIHGTCF